MLSWAIIVCLASISRAHITVLSWEPRIHLHHGMLDENEIAHLLALSSSRFAASELEVGANDQRRTSESWMVPRTVERDDAVVAGAVKRMHAAVGIPPRYGEALQVARYNSTRNYYNFHADSAKSTARVATKARSSEMSAAIIVSSELVWFMMKMAGFRRCCSPGCRPR